MAKLWTLYKLSLRTLRPLNVGKPNCVYSPWFGEFGTYNKVDPWNTYIAYYFLHLKLWKSEVLSKHSLPGLPKGMWCTRMSYSDLGFWMSITFWSTKGKNPNIRILVHRVERCHAWMSKDSPWHRMVIVKIIWMLSYLNCVDHHGT